MIRLLVVLAMYLAACADEDPATSDYCKSIRAEYLRRRELMQMGAAGGADPALVRQADFAIAKFQSDNWECFK